MKIEESKNINEYCDLARETKKLWDMKVTVIPILVGVPGTVSKSLEKDWRNLKPKEESRPSRPQQSEDWLEYSG